ncbi:MAG: hypothetical protein ABI321_04740 [Polyangia bacterium]
MHRRHTARTLTLLSLALSGCQKPTAVDFVIQAPTNALLDPFSLSVSDFVLKTQAGSIVAAVSAGASKDGKGRLALGELTYTLSGDLRLDVMAGPQLVGMAHIEGVKVEKGKTDAWTAPVRKPLVAVGSAASPEDTATNQMGPLAAQQLLDPTTSTDLASGLKLPTAQTASFTSDGTHLVLGTTNGFYVVDTGSGAVTGPATLPFTPYRVAIATNDAGIAFIERGSTSSRVLWFSDVAGLIADPGMATGAASSLTQGRPRTAHFSADGKTLYVLVEASGDEPCTGLTAPAANQIIPIVGNIIGTAIRMPSYVADFAVEPGGALLLAESVGNQIAVLDPTSGSAPAKLYAATCPSAVRVLGDQVYAVTNDADVAGTFGLMHGQIDGAMQTRLPVVLPTYSSPLTNTSTPDMKTNANLELAPTAIVASEFAVSPDGTSAVVAIRARYREVPSMTNSFDLLGLTCVAGVDIVEYGLYSINLSTGTASYTMRSQTIVTSNADAMGSCVHCESQALGIELPLPCANRPGDRAAGLAAAFSEGQ